ncbi:MAG: c-type cytochrome [Thermodesulfobacteriota bacterium]
MKSTFPVSAVLSILAAALLLTAAGCGEQTPEAEKKSEAVAEKTPEPKKEAAVEAVGTEPTSEETTKEKIVEDVAPDGYTTPRVAYARKNGIPEEFRGLSNPIEATAENIETGGKLFLRQCVMCHGTGGKGDGLGGKSLNPPPSNLALLAGTVSDGYLFWAMTEGGKTVGSLMPSLKGISEENRWQLVLYMKEELREKQ